MLDHSTPIPVAWSVFAAVLLAIIVVTVARLWVRRGRELRSAQQQWSNSQPDEITVADIYAIDAFAIDGTRSTRRVVLTAGLLRELTDPALQHAVIEHEQAHLRHHHLLYRIAVATAATANPLLTPVPRSVNEALEAWADDDAATTAGHATVATAIATIALAQQRQPTHVVLNIAEGPTRHRIERLLHPQAPSRVGIAIGSTLAICALIILAVSCRQTESFFELLRTASQH